MCEEFDMPDLPIVCTLTPDALRARREGLLADLLRQSTGHELLPEGLRLRFAPSADTLARIARAVEADTSLPLQCAQPRGQDVPAGGRLSQSDEW